MVDGSSWQDGETRSPSVIPDDDVRNFLADRSAGLFTSQLQTRLRDLEQTKETPKFLRRDSYSLYLEGHFALLDPRELERTTLSPTPPSVDDWTSSDQTPEPEPARHTSHNKISPIENAFPQLNPIAGRIDRKRGRLQVKRNARTNSKRHRMLRRSKTPRDTVLYELDWVGRNMITVYQSMPEDQHMLAKKG